MQRKQLPIIFITLSVLISGLANLFEAAYHAPATAYHTPHPILRELSPLEFFHFPRSFTLLLGFALVVSAVNIYKRKRRAWQTVLAFTAFSFLLQGFKEWHFWQGISALILMATLLYARRSFVVKSRELNWQTTALRLTIATLAAFSYGVAGFWLLDPKHFGVNFNWLASMRQTLLCLSLIGDSALVPQTRYAVWFLDSLQVLMLTLAGYALLVVFRPMLYRLRTLPQEREHAKDLLAHHGRTALDYFKLWPDKSYFFNETRDCFIAYRVGANIAVALGDPLGPQNQIRATIKAFKQFCEDNGWAVSWHQTTSNCLPLFRQAGLKRLKIGDDAIVDLTEFKLTNPRFKRFRQRVGQLEKQGVCFRSYPAPLSDELLAQLRTVSDEWLQLPGKRERTFTLGCFEPEYLRTTTVFTAEDKEGNILAFVNLLPSLRTSEATIDLMRHRLHPPNGIMDYLFVKLFCWCQDHGFARFNLGMAPMAGFQEREHANAAERAVHGFFQHLSFIFNFRGIKQYKAKFADTWEPRYVIYRNVFDLPKIGLALNQLTELKENKFRLLSETAWPMLSAELEPHAESMIPDGMAVASLPVSSALT